MGSKLGLEFPGAKPSTGGQTSPAIVCLQGPDHDVLGELNRSLGRLYASEGRPSIPPEQLLSALLLQVF